MSPFASRVERARRDYADRTPASRAYHERARTVLPGGHTRTVLAFPPYPLAFVAGEGSWITDADGQSYRDFLGDYTAGLLGHSPVAVREAALAALAANTSVGGVHPHEERFARLMCERFGIDRVRFTNSGTEANLMALTTARLATGRSTVVAMFGGYHGGVLYFASGKAAWNAPYPVELAPFNDIDGAVAVLDAVGDDLAAVIVEPMMGSAGCVPADASFLEALFARTRELGGVSIADEVMTSRHGRAGMCHLLGVRPDLTTYGKYLGGGFSFGAFGGDAALMGRYDSTQPTYIPHAGTFNNNVATMAAGAVVLSEMYTADIAEAHTARGEAFRGAVSAVVARHKLPLCVTGYGSMMNLHTRPEAPTDGATSLDRDAALQELVFLGLLQRGIYTAPRGMVNLSLPLTDEDLAVFCEALDDTCAELAA